MTFLPDISVLLAFSVACLVVFVTPGPDMSLFLAKTVEGGRKAGLAAMLGTMLGCCVHTMLVALGLSALLATSTTAFTIIKLVGGLYLLWLAVGAIRHGSALNVRSGAEGAKSRVSMRRSFFIGLGVDLTNPKIVLFFVTFLPQFVMADDPHAAAKLVFLGLYYVAFTLPLAALLILVAERVIAALRRRPRIMRAIDYLFAGVFGAFAIKILAMEGR
ncbi:Threonine/homoserine/homoserine lactone efflux protein [Rhizobiales bacterium GAS191]|jgi:threonine/homoserine/homoserine lactone efflux protein|nr:Threonine/homoserine/homoserine lactone efflux protein [Rhizobiales bacterium GAS191]